MSETLEPKVKKLQILKVLPYVNPDADADGISVQLAKYGNVLHDGANYREQLTYLEKNGVKRYLTGLNEFAPEIVALKGDDKLAAIREIRLKVIYLEKALGSNEIDIEDKEFWSKVQTVHPTNHNFWNGIFIEPGNEPLFLNPEDPDDLIKISAIEAGGFSIVAKSYEDARMAASPPKFYLDRATETANTKTEVKKIKNKAIENLSKYSAKGGKTLFYIAKIINNNGYQYKNDTAPDIIYDYLDDYINGKGFQKSIKKAATEFNAICELPTEELRIRAVIADGSFYKIIAAKSDGLLYHRSTDTIVGKNITEVTSYFKNPLYSDLWETLYDEVETFWKE